MVEARRGDQDAPKTQITLQAVTRPPIDAQMKPLD